MLDTAIELANFVEEIEAQAKKLNINFSAYGTIEWENFLKGVKETPTRLSEKETIYNYATSMAFGLSIALRNRAMRLITTLITQAKKKRKIRKN